MHVNTLAAKWNDWSDGSTNAVVPFFSSAALHHKNG